MNELRRVLCAAILSLGCSFGTQAGDLLISTSSINATALDGAVSQVLEQERMALNLYSKADADRLVRRPKRTKGVDVYSRDYLESLPSVKGDKQWYCLTEALYFEARGEEIIGQFAVAEVILNRVSSKRFPGSVCEVVNQGTGKKFRCQFSYTCDGRAEHIGDQRAWDRAGKISRLMLRGAPRQLTGGATHYHTKAVNPNWSRVFSHTRTIGEHKFYDMTKSAASS